MDVVHLAEIGEVLRDDPGAAASETANVEMAIFLKVMSRQQMQEHVYLVLNQYISEEERIRRFAELLIGQKRLDFRRPKR